MRRALLIALIVATITTALYWPARENEIVKWDDDLYLAHAARQQRLSAAAVRWAFTTLSPFYYHPLTWLSHIADHQFWGENYRPQHTTNILLHAANSALATWIVWLLLAHWNDRERGWAAALTGLLFGIHPLQVESVAWLAERKNLLSGFFSLACVLAYLQHVHQSARRRLWYGASLFLFLAALLSKPMAVPLPVVLLLLDWQPLQRFTQRPAVQLLREKWPFFVLSVVCGVLTILGQLEWGAVKDMTSLGFFDRLLVAARGSVFYLWKFVWPTWLSPFYPLGLNTGLHNPEFLLASAIVVAISVLSVALVKRLPLLLATWLMYLVLLAPTSGLVQTGGQGAADRFAYLAVLVMATTLVGGGFSVARVSRPIVGVLLAAVFVVSTLGFALRTQLMIPVWRNEETLWRHVLRFYPRVGIAHFHLAMALLEQHRFDEALPHARLASELIPDNALARSTTGLLLLKAGDFAGARHELQAAVLLDPQLWAARYNLACAHVGLTDYASAIELLAVVVSNQPACRSFLRRDPALQPLREHPAYRTRFEELASAP